LVRALWRALGPMVARVLGLLWVLEALVRLLGLAERGGLVVSLVIFLVVGLVLLAERVALLGLQGLAAYLVVYLAVLPPLGLKLVVPWLVKRLTQLLCGLLKPKVWALQMPLLAVPPRQLLVVLVVCLLWVWSGLASPFLGLCQVLKTLLPPLHPKSPRLALAPCNP
jgi:hypothetical protein